MRIAIVDDHIKDQDKLAAMLAEYCTAHKLSAEYVCFSSAEELLKGFHPGGFDLIFLDIYMDGMTGMEAAQMLCKLDPACRLIFFTTSQNHAVQSYEVRAAYYLTKPLNQDRLSSAMDAACKEIMRDSRSLAVHSMGADFTPLLRDIVYVDCAAERTRIHLSGHTVEVRERFSPVAARLLEDERFLNCNRNVTVNMDWIARAVKGEFLLKTGEHLSIRQHGRVSVERAFLQYSLCGLGGEAR